MLIMNSSIPRIFTPILFLLVLAANSAGQSNHPDSVAMIPCVDDYIRIQLKDDSFADYVRHLPLKEIGSPVKSWSGSIIHEGDEIHAVIDWQLPHKVQQCADVAIRLRAEYLSEHGQIEKIKFKSLSGNSIEYSKWLHGRYALNSAGSKIEYRKSQRGRRDTDEEFEKYLRFVMTYANSSSLARDLKTVGESGLLPGDIYIQPDPSGRGGIGHVSVILDVCENTHGERLYLFGYGFIPAQDFHLPLPETGQGIGKWFTLDGYRDFIAMFGDGDFHRL